MAQRFTTWVLWQLKSLIGYRSPLRLPYPTSQADRNDQPPWPAAYTSSIIQLPLEVIGEILKYLDWKDISNASLADRRWYQATHSRQLWYAMANDLQLTCGMGRLEEPMGDYTVDELRRWIVRRLRTQEAWNTANVSTIVSFKKHQIDHPDMDMRIAKLLPGGRWLFVNNHDGELFYYDLESTALEKRLLIDPGLGDNATKPDRLDDFAFWIDQSKTKLSFRVALWNGIGGRRMEVTRTCIYQVDLVGHGETAALVTEPLSVVRDHNQTIKWAVGLSEKYLVDCRFLNHRDRRLSLVQYGASDPESTRISLPYSTSRACKIYITPSDHIVVVGVDCIDVYAIRQLEEYEDNNLQVGDQHELSPLHHIICDAALVRASAPFVFQGNTWFVYWHQDRIQLIRLPCVGDDLKTVSLGEYPLPTNPHDRNIFFLGPTYTIRVGPDYTADAIIYSWNDEMNVTGFSTRPITIPTFEKQLRRFSPAGIEGGIGRIVFRSPRGKECIVLDLVL